MGKRVLVPLPNFVRYNHSVPACTKYEELIETKPYANVRIKLNSSYGIIT